ncbi:formyl peptide receptor-related sequence 1-like isoform X2 [Bolinopsis microptera]|uniref:formyl peptide receptor-related sequence 1-like isoform X2 n=1 Tax=Bolinopsis microptera TaxID=2820187 RepID=UPI0030793D07
MEKSTLEISGQAVLNSSSVNMGQYLDQVTERPPPVTMMWNQHAIPSVDILLALVCIVLTLVSTCGNAVSIRAIINLKSRFNSDRNNLGSLTLVIFLNLAVCDFLQTLLSAPFTALMLFSGRVQPGISPTTELILCNVAGVSYFIMSRASISIVAILSLVRCYVILRPMNHHSVVNWRNVYVSLTVVWLTAIFLSLIPFMAGGTYKYWRIYPMCEWDKLERMFPWTNTITLSLAVLLVYVTPFLLPGFVVIFSSLTTVGALLYARQKKKIVTRKKDYDSVITDKGQGSISRKQLSASITTLVVVLTFAVCYGLWWFNSIVYLMWKAGFFPVEKDSMIFTVMYGHTGYVYIATMGGVLMIYLNSALNPIIYYCRIFSKNSQDYKTSSSGPKVNMGHQSSSSIEFSNRNSIVNLCNTIPKRESDTEKILDTLEERDETPTTSDSMA